MIKKVYIKPYIMMAYCDECGERLLPTGTVLTTYPEQFPYYCPKCNKSYTFKSYEGIDRIQYEEIEDEI